VTSNNTCSGAVKNNNSTAPTNLEGKFAETLGGTEDITTTQDEDGNWTKVPSHKSLPRNTDKQNRESEEEGGHHPPP